MNEAYTLNINIRRAEPHDSAALFQLASEFASSFAVEKTAFERALTELVTHPETFLAVAEVDAELVGYVLGSDHWTLFANGRVAWVEEIMVAEASRRQSVGAKLMEAFEEWAKAREAKIIALATRRAASFYEALGFEESAAYFRKRL